MKKKYFYVLFVIICCQSVFANNKNKTNKKYEHGYNYEYHCDGAKKKDRYDFEDYHKYDCIKNLEKFCAAEFKTGFEEDIDACLWRNVDKLTSQKCKNKIIKKMNKNNCLQDIKTLCAKNFESGCNKDIKNCLRNNIDNITNKKCKREIFKDMKD